MIGANAKFTKNLIIVASLISLMNSEAMNSEATKQATRAEFDIYNQRDSTMRERLWQSGETFKKKTESNEEAKKDTDFTAKLNSLFKICQGNYNFYYNALPLYHPEDYDEESDEENDEENQRIPAGAPTLEELDKQNESLWSGWGSWKGALSIHATDGWGKYIEEYEQLFSKEQTEIAQTMSDADITFKRRLDELRARAAREGDAVTEPPKPEAQMEPASALILDKTESDDREVAGAESSTELIVPRRLSTSSKTSDTRQDVADIPNVIQHRASVQEANETHKYDHINPARRFSFGRLFKNTVIGFGRVASLPFRGLAWGYDWLIQNPYHPVTFAVQVVPHVAFLCLGWQSGHRSSNHDGATQVPLRLYMAETMISIYHSIPLTGRRLIARTLANFLGNGRYNFGMAAVDAITRDAGTNLASLRS